MLGGGMRQAGGLAAAALFALQHHVTRLADDHRRAALLADALRRCVGARGAGGSHPDTRHPDTRHPDTRHTGTPRVRHATNMVFLALEPSVLRAIAAHHRERGILVGDRERLVLHLDVDDLALERVIGAYRDFFAS